jgi:SSS family solute:Na+ symporter
MAAVLAASVLSAALARGGHKMTLEQWTVGDRKFGLAVMWLLMAGEVYTTYAFQGMSGWVYARGAPVLYSLAYLPLSNIVTFFVGPVIWELGRRHGLQTQADFFGHLYGGRFLPALVAALGIAAIIPYLQLQLTGLGIIVSAASFGAVGQGEAEAVAAFFIAALVLLSGIRAVAGMSILKDLLMVAAALAIGLAIPRMLFGGIGNMFKQAIALHPAHMTMPGATGQFGHAWFVTAVLASSLGPVWPHGFASLYSARSGATVRVNSVLLPLYNLTLPCVIFVGFAALLTLPHLPNGDQAFMAIVRAHFPPWLLGLVGGAGALAATVPACILLLTASTLFAKNIVRPVIAPAMTDLGVARFARVLVVALTCLSLYFSLQSSATIVGLLQLGYGMVGQFFPGIVLGLAWRRSTGRAVGAGIVCGSTMLFLLEATGHDPAFGMNAGFVSVCVNLSVMVILSLMEVGTPTSWEARSGTGGAA